MPGHVRKQIRDYVANGLGNLATTADRVYVGRTRPLTKGHGPALLIYMRSETAERTVQGTPGKVTNACTLHIEGRVSTTEPPDDLLDQIDAEIQAGMAAMIDFGSAKVFGGLASNAYRTGTEIIAEADGERHIGGIRVEYLVTYRTVEGAATVVA